MNDDNNWGIFMLALAILFCLSVGIRGLHDKLDKVLENQKAAQVTP